MNQLINDKGVCRAAEILREGSPPPTCHVSGGTCRKSFFLHYNFFCEKSGEACQ